MAFDGMDVEAAARVSGVLEHQASNEVSNVITIIDGLLPQLATVWRGADATRFDQAWSDHRKNLTALQDAMADLVASLNRGITDQRATSGN